MADPILFTGRDLDIAARTLFGEARGEPLRGQQAVAWVIRTRASWQPPAWWGHTIDEVCTKPHQFSCWNPRDANYWKLISLPETDPQYVELHEVARSVFAGEIDDPTSGPQGDHATHYERVGAGATWAQRQEFRCIIGKHAFYAIGPSHPEAGPPPPHIYGPRLIHDG